MRDLTNKNLLNSLITIGLIASFIIYMTSTSLFGITIVSGGDSNDVLKVAINETPDSIDPVDSWSYYHMIASSFVFLRTPTNTPESISNNILNQVVETLIAYDLSDPSFPLKGRLAESWDFQSTIFGTNITFQLRENVFFHDGSEFTGECVLHTIERINYFSNWTGTLDPALHEQALSHSLYKFSNEKPIFNHSSSFVNPADNLEVTVILNAPYGPAEGLLAYTASSIVHPNSTPVNTMLDPLEDLLIGTGSFKLECFIPDSSIRLARWDRYWSTGPFWDKILYVYYEDLTIANNAMLSGNVDYLVNPLDSLISDFEADPDIAVVGDDPLNYSNGPVYWFIGINSIAINRTWRKAICHAFNYSYLINNIEENKAARANSLIHPRIPGHNSSIQACTYNISYARTLMQSMGYGVGWEVGTMNGDQFIPGANEANWQGALFTPAVGNFTAGHLNFLHRSASHFMTLLFQRFAEDMDLIGIGIESQDITWYQFIDPIDFWDNLRWRIHLFYSGWGSDYVEAFNTIDPLVNPLSDYNLAFINDTEINDLLDQVRTEPNTAQRYQYYQKLQYIIHEKNYYHMPLTYDKTYYVHSATLQGFPYNPMRMLYLYPTYRSYS